MNLRFVDKAAARQCVWDLLATERVARFPFPPHGRIPNFAGAREAALRLLDHALFVGAAVLKVNPDAPQRPVREEALRRGQVVLMPTPRLRAGFRCLDPERIPKDEIARAASLSGSQRFGRELPLQGLPRIDAIVCGSVAVTRTGRRWGKGEGYSDLEFAILRELGHPEVPVATTVHGLQIVAELPWDPTDLPVSLIASPEVLVPVSKPPPSPERIDWTRLGEEDLLAMPVLRQLRELTGSPS